MGILAANRIFLGEIGSLDGGMLVYGGENVELSLRVGTFPSHYETKQKGNNWRIVRSSVFWNKVECHWLKRWTDSHVSESLEIGSKTSGVELSGLGLYNLGDMDGER